MEGGLESGVAAAAEPAAPEADAVTPYAWTAPSQAGSAQGGGGATGAVRVCSRAGARAG